MTAVKVCGLTRERDVRLAVECGAWACGFVLTESPRRVTPQQAAALARAAAAFGAPRALRALRPQARSPRPRALRPPVPAPRSPSRW